MSSLATPPALSLPPSDSDKDTATFYLTLTIEANKKQAALAKKGCEGLIGGQKDLKSVLEMGRISNVGVIERPKSCSALMDAKSGSRSEQRKSSYSRTLRPKQAPPAPPSGECETHFFENFWLS